MLKYHTFDILCKEVPDEVSLCFNITGCIVKCPGCNTKTLWKERGTDLTFNEIRSLLKNYSSAITCVCFMGGEQDPGEINALARFVKHSFPCLRTAWYSGLGRIPKEIDIKNFDYIKIGNYQASKGGLNSPDTNQKMYKIDENGQKINITKRFIRTEPDEVVKREDNTIAQANDIVETETDTTAEIAETTASTEVAINETTTDNNITIEETEEATYIEHTEITIENDNTNLEQSSETEKSEDADNNRTANEDKEGVIMEI